MNHLFIMTRTGLLAALLLPNLTIAALNDTGITQCANLTQNNLTCPQAGFPSQDAEIGRDAQQQAGTLGKIGGGSAGFDFTKLDANGNPLPAAATSWDCVRDNVTGLVWEIKTTDSGLRDKDWTYTWCNTNSATNGGNAGTCDTGSGVGSDKCYDPARCDTEKYVADVNALRPTLCGYTDWRMPSHNELRSIVDYSRHSPAIDATYFLQPAPHEYWSASPGVQGGSGNAWLVGFDNGADDGPSKSFPYGAVRLVHGGPPYTLETTPTSDFILDDVNGTAYHKTTGLTWKRCSEGQSWDSVNKTCTGGGPAYTWSAALSLASGEWRLPNVKELASIVEESSGSYPVVNARVFPNTIVSPFYWSASPYAPNAGYAWYVTFYNGTAYVDNVGNLNAVRLVRGGQYALLSVLKAGTGSGTVGGGGTFPYNTTVTPTAIAATGSTFTGWSPASCGNPFNLTANTTCTATFMLDVTLTVNKAGTGSGTVGGGGTFPYNTTVTPIATAATGSTFTGWTPASCGNPFKLTADTTCTATFTLNIPTHTVTVRAGLNGSVTPPTQPVSHGATTSFTVTPAAGYTVRALGCGGALSGTTYTTGPITTDCTVTARFTRPGETFPTTTGGDAFSAMNNASGSAAYATGDNTLGQLGAGSSSSPSQARPQAFVGRSIYPVRVYWTTRRTSRAVELATAVPLAAADTPDFIALASAATHTLALRGDGTVWAWGDNAKGQLGNGTTNPAYEPVQVMADSSGPLTGVIAIAAGRDHSVTVKSDGTVWTWGDNTYGQLGDNSFSTTQRLYPVPVLAGDAPNLAPLSGVKAVAASDVHTLALKTDGTVWAWGNNDAGQLGIGTTAERRTATPVAVLNDVQAITARGASSSSDHAASSRNLAQRRDGSIWGWGDDTDCELGDTAAALGSAAPRISTPVRLANLSNLGLWVCDIAQGDAHGIASTPDGIAWTWGRNNQGQLGDNTTTTRCAPIPVPGVSAVETVGAGAEHTFVTLRDGWVWGWGRNDQGQLGVGDTNPRLTPTQMKGEYGVSFLNLKVEPPTTLLADVNGDGVVNALDVVAVINAVLGVQSSPAADVNNDGAINALDVVFVINQVLGL